MRRYYKDGPLTIRHPLAGHPRPRLIWRSGRAVMATESRIEGDDVIGDFVIDSLSRSDLHRMLTCSGSNTNLTAPVTKTVVIDMNCE